MKKFLSILFSILIINSLYASAEETTPTDEWSEIGNMQDAWDGQKIITDDQFEKIIEQKTRHSKEKEKKRFRKKVGEAINPNFQTETNMKEIKKMAEDYPTLLVPKALIIDNIVIPTGFYRVLAAKSKQENFYINFYQGNNLIGKIPATETKDDYGAETINYAKIIYTDQDQRAKIVYGCLEYNLVAETGTR